MDETKFQVKVQEKIKIYVQPARINHELSKINSKKLNGFSNISSLLITSWDSITTLTAAQKDNLRTASLQFQKIDNGVKDVMRYLKEIENDADNDRKLQPDEAMIKQLVERYQVRDQRKLSLSSPLCIPKVL